MNNQQESEGNMHPVVQHALYAAEFGGTAVVEGHIITAEIADPNDLVEVEINAQYGRAIIRRTARVGVGLSVIRCETVLLREPQLQEAREVVSRERMRV